MCSSIILPFLVFQFIPGNVFRTKSTVYYRVKGENLRLVFVVKIHGSPFTREILLDS